MTPSKFDLRVADLLGNIAPSLEGFTHAETIASLLFVARELVNVNINIHTPPPSCALFLISIEEVISDLRANAPVEH